jgi:hypothetical protein
MPSVERLAPHCSPPVWPWSIRISWPVTCTRRTRRADVLRDDLAGGRR